MFAAEAIQVNVLASLAARRKGYKSRSDGGAEIRMTNDECPMTKEIRNPNDEGKTCARAGTGSTFGLCHSFDIRHSDFVIVQSLLTSAATEL